MFGSDALDRRRPGGGVCPSGGRGRKASRCGFGCSWLALGADCRSFRASLGSRSNVELNVHHPLLKSSSFAPPALTPALSRRERGQERSEIEEDFSTACPS